MRMSEGTRENGKGKKREEEREREREGAIVTTVCPIRQEAPTVMRFFLTYAYRGTRRFLFAIREPAKRDARG